MNPALMSMVQGFLQQLNLHTGGGIVPWAIREDALALSISSVQALRTTATVSNAALPIGRYGARIAQNSFATRVGNVAIVPVLGPLVARMHPSFWSYDEIVRDLRLVSSIPDIEAVLLDVDSPGGIGYNVEAVPAEIRRVRERMPVVAHVNGMAASAGYWVASGAESIVAAETALVGSVGALISHLNMEGIMTRLGATKTEVIAEQSPNKRLARDSDEGRAELQAIVDEGAEMFIQGLVANRGVPRETIMEQYGQGLVFPAAEAHRRGLVDRIASFEDVLADLAGRRENTTVAASATASAVKQEAPDMITLESLKTEHPDLANALRAEGAAAAAAAERDRLLGIEQMAAGLSGHEDLVAKLKADGKTTPAEAAVQLLAAEKTANASRIEGLRQLDAAAAGVTSTLSGGAAVSGQAVPQTEEGWKAEWSATPKLQGEYPTAESYVAVKKREARKTA